MRWIATLILALVMSAPGYTKDYSRMNKIPMHLICVGRMLVDLPIGGVMNWQQHFNYAQVWRLSSDITSHDAFWAMVDAKKAVLAGVRHKTEPSLLSEYLSIGDDAAMLLHRESSTDIYGYDLDRYLWVGHWGYWFESKALLDNSQKSQFTSFSGVFGQLSEIDNLKAPQRPGFCIDGALVAGKVGPIWSGVTSSVKGWKGVSVDAGASEDDGTRPKMSWEKSSRKHVAPSPFEDLDMFKSWASESMKTDDDDRVTSFETLRKSRRQSGGMPGEEIAVKVTLANGQEWYRFEWDTVDDESRAMKSGFAMGLVAGDKDYTSNYAAPPPQDDLLALWDAMLDSLKPRPGAR